MTLLPERHILPDKSRYGEGLACMDMADGALVIVIEGTRGGPGGKARSPASRKLRIITPLP